MQIRCPHCHSAIDLVDEASLADVDCPACGSHVSLLGGSSTTVTHGVDGGIEISDTLHRVGIYVAAQNPSQRTALDARRQELVHDEEQPGFDPARNDEDFELLVRFAKAQSDD